MGTEGNVARFRNEFRDLYDESFPWVEEKKRRREVWMPRTLKNNDLLLNFFVGREAFSPVWSGGQVVQMGPGDQASQGGPGGLVVRWSGGQVVRWSMRSRCLGLPGWSGWS